MIVLPTSAVLVGAETSGYIMKQGDTLPPLLATLLQGNGQPLDLTGATVTFFLVNTRGRITKVARQCRIILPLAGSLEMDWIVGDTDTGSAYTAEFQVVYPSGAEITVPSDGYLTFEILAELG